MARRLVAVTCLLTLFVAGPVARADDPATRARPGNIQTSIRGATQMFAAPWGLVAQGSGQLRILPLEYGRGPEHGPWALFTDRVTKPTPLFIGTLLRDPEDRYAPC